MIRWIFKFVFCFRLLSDVSKSTKGVIVLICEGVDAKRVIEESKKLNMVNGDFVWLWIDTGAMLLNDKSIKLEKIASKEATNSAATELRKVRHTPNFYVNESRTPQHQLPTTSSNRSKKLLRNRDNNAAVASRSNRVFCNRAANRSSDIYQNKTEIKSVHNIVINTTTATSNEILPNFEKGGPPSSSSSSALAREPPPSSSSSALSINALMKHHFGLYRKKAQKARRIAKDAEKMADAQERKTVKLMNKAPIRLKSTNGGSNESTPLLLSVINEETNLSKGLINNDSNNNTSREKRILFVKNGVSNTTHFATMSPSTIVSSTASISVTPTSSKRKRNAKLLDIWKNITRLVPGNENPVSRNENTSPRNEKPVSRNEKPVSGNENHTNGNLIPRNEKPNQTGVFISNTVAAPTVVGNPGNRVPKSVAYEEEQHVNFGVPIFLENVTVMVPKNKTVPVMPVGILALLPIPPKIDKSYVKSSLKLLIGTLKKVIAKYGDAKLSKLLDLPRISCFDFSPITHNPDSIMEEFTQ